MHHQAARAGASALAGQTSATPSGIQLSASSARAQSASQARRIKAQQLASKGRARQVGAPHTCPAANNGTPYATSSNGASAPSDRNADQSQLAQLQQQMAQMQALLAAQQAQNQMFQQQVMSLMQTIQSSGVAAPDVPGLPAPQAAPAAPVDVIPPAAVTANTPVAPQQEQQTTAAPPTEQPTQTATAPVVAATAAAALSKTSTAPVSRGRRALPPDFLPPLHPTMSSNVLDAALLASGMPAVEQQPTNVVAQAKMNGDAVAADVLPSRTDVLVFDENDQPVVVSPATPSSPPAAAVDAALAVPQAAAAPAVPTPAQVSDLQSRLDQVSAMNDTLMKLLQSRGVAVGPLLGDAQASAKPVEQAVPERMDTLPPPTPDTFAHLPPLAMTAEEAARKANMEAARNLELILKAPKQRPRREEQQETAKGSAPVAAAQPRERVAKGATRQKRQPTPDQGSPVQPTGRVMSDMLSSPRYKRMLAATSWNDLKRFAAQEQQKLDTFHAAALLSRIPHVVADSLPLPSLAAAGGKAGGAPESDELSGQLDPNVQEARVLASELATLLTLQLSRLSPESLAAVVQSVGELRAAPKGTWVNTTMTVVERKLGSLTPSQLVECALGLAGMACKPSAAWTSKFWTDTLAHMKANRLSLADLANLASAVHESSTAGDGVGMGKPSAEWTGAWHDAVVKALSEAGITAGAQGSSKDVPPQVAVGVVLGADSLQVALAPDLTLALIESAVPTESAENDQKAEAGRQGLSLVSGARLACLAPALVRLQVTPSARFQQAYVQDLWGKLYQLTPAATISAFNGLTHWTCDLPAVMLSKVLQQVTVSKEPGSLGPAETAASSPQATKAGTAQKSRAVQVGSLQTVDVADLVQFMVQFDRAVQASAAGGQVAASSLKHIQLHIAALNWKDLSADTVVTLVAAVVNLVRTAASALAHSLDVSPSPAPHVEQSLLFAVFKSLKGRPEQLSPQAFASLCTSVVYTGQVDLEFVEQYLTLLLESTAAPGASMASALTVVIKGLGMLATGGTKARSGVLGPLIAKTMIAIPELSVSQMLSILGSMAQMKLTAKDTQGVRNTTTQGIPTPAEFIDAILLQLQPQLSTLTFEQLSDLAGALSATAHPSSAAWVADLIHACEARLEGASVPTLVSLLSSLPGISSSIAAGPEGAKTALIIQQFKESCVQKIGDGVSELSMPALADLMTAVAASQTASTAGVDASTAAFACAVLSSSQKQLEHGDKPGIKVLTQLASALASVTAYVPPRWLYLVQASTLSMMGTIPEADVALLAWSVAKLAGVRRGATASLRELFRPAYEDEQDLEEAVADLGLSPTWHAALEQRVTQQRLGQIDAYGLEDLARLMWGCAALGITPRQGLLNSFAGKSMDRLSSLHVDLTLESAWAMAALGFQMNAKWINQWGVAVQGGRLKSLGASDLYATLWALGFHALGPQQQFAFPVPPMKPGRRQQTAAASKGPADPTMASTSTPPPSAIMSQLSGTLSRIVNSSQNDPDAPAPYTPHQAVHLAATIASLGHVPSRSSAVGLATLACPQQPHLPEAAATLSAGELVALLWSQAKFGAEPSATWTSTVLARLQPKLADLSAIQLSRLLWTLASLPHQPLPADLITTCIDLLSAAQTPEAELTNAPAAGKPQGKGQRDGRAGAVTSQAAAALAGSKIARLVPGDVVDCIWALVKLGGSAPAGWWDLLPGKLVNRMNMLSAQNVTNLLWACQTARHILPAELANDLSKASAMRFGGLPAPELSDLVYSFAKLGISLPPAFAASSVRRLQSNMANLGPSQLARMLWSFSMSGFAFLPQQLDAYQSRVVDVLPEMQLQDLAMVLDSFERLQLKPSAALLDALEEAAAKRLASPSAESDSTPDNADRPSSQPAEFNSDTRQAIEGMIPLLQELSRAGRTPNANWLSTWTNQLTVDVLQRLSPDTVVQLMDAMSSVSFAGFNPSQTWCTVLLRRLAEIVPTLDGKKVTALARFMVGMDRVVSAHSSSEPDVAAAEFQAARAAVLSKVPELLAAKLRILNATELTSLIRCAASLRFSFDFVLMKQMVDQIKPQAAVLGVDVQVALMNDLLVQVELCREQDREVDMQKMLFVVRPLHEDILMLLHVRDEQLNATHVSLALASASRMQTYGRYLDQVVDPEQTQQISQEIKNWGKSMKEVQRRTVQAGLGAKSEPSLNDWNKMAGSDRVVVCLTDDDFERCIKIHDSLIERCRADGSEEALRQAETLESMTPWVGHGIQCLWAGDMYRHWARVLKRSKQPEMQAYVTGLAALDQMELVAGTDMTDQVLELALKHLPGANVEQCCSLAGLLAKNQLEPSEPWLRAYVDALHAAMVVEMGGEEESAAGAWALPPALAHDLLFALSFWAPKFAKKDPVGSVLDTGRALASALGAGSKAGNAAAFEPFPVSQKVGQALVASLELAAPNQGTMSQAPRDVAEWIGRLCLISAAQGGRGVSLSESWLSQQLTACINPSSQPFKTNPLVMAAQPGAGAIPDAEQLLEQHQVWMKESDPQGLLDLQSVVVLLEGLIALDKPVLSKSAGLQEAVCEAVLATCIHPDRKLLRRALVSMFKLKLRPSSQWREVLGSARRLFDQEVIKMNTDYIRETLRQEMSDEEREQTLRQGQAVISEAEQDAEAINTWLQALKA